MPLTLPATIQNTIGNQFILAPSTQDPSTLTAVTAGAMVLGLDTAPWDRDANLQDATTQLTNGFYQSAPTIKKWSGTATGKAVLGVPLTLAEGAIYAAAMGQAHGVSIYGYVRVGKIHEQLVGPSTLASYSFDFVNEGTYTVTTAA